MALYHLQTREAANLWAALRDEYVTSVLGYSKSVVEPGLYYRVDEDGAPAFISILNDDTKIAAPPAERQRVTSTLQKKFKITNNGDVKHYAGLGISMEKGVTTIFQTAAIEKLAATYLQPVELEHLDAKVSHGRAPRQYFDDNFRKKIEEDVEPLQAKYNLRSIIGAILYIARATRYDVLYPTIFISSFLNKPTVSAYNGALKIVAYLYATRQRTIVIPANCKLEELVLYVDAAHANDGNCRSHYGMTLCVARDGLLTPLSGVARTIKSVCTSSTEAEYIGISEAAKYTQYLNNIFLELSVVASPIVVPILTDSDSGKNALQPPFKGRSRMRHVHLRYHQVKDMVTRGEVEIRWVPGAANVADILTKVSPSVVHNKICTMLFREGEGAR
jgi:hypothetical protein